MKDIPILQLKSNGSSDFKLGAFLSSGSHNSVTFCSIFKNKVSKFKLKLFYQIKHNFLYIWLQS